jgi:rhodanese-related sulfurtransferase
MPFPDLTPAEVHPELERYRVVDVRESHEFDGPLGFVDRTELVPLSTIPANAEKLAGSRPLLLVCRSGRRSAKACELLQELGLEDVVNLAGGMIAWNRARLPVTRTEPASLPSLVDQIVAWIDQVAPPRSGSARDIVRERFRARRVDSDAPSRDAVDDLIGFVGEWLEDVDPPDLELSLASFRRSLAALP